MKFFKYRKSLFLIKKALSKLNSNLTLSRSNPTISETKNSIAIIRGKINVHLDTSKNRLSFSAYEKYFNFLIQLELSEELKINTTQDNLVVQGTSIKPILFSSNNKKVIIFCHGVTSNRWSLFYCLHLALQLGYQVITYDARNHGLSEKSYTSLGQVEASDLQDVIKYVKKKYQPEKVALYGFSMGAATCLFWISHFAGQENLGVVLAICEAPFDNFSQQWKLALSKGKDYYWKEYLASKLISGVLNSSYQDLEKVNPLDALPAVLPVKLLLIHGLKDSIIHWKSSLNIFNKLKKNELNKKKVNLYFCRHADHGEIPFLGDFLPQSLLWKNKKKVSCFTFSTLFFNYLGKNF